MAAKIQRMAADNQSFIIAEFANSARSQNMRSSAIAATKNGLLLQAMSEYHICKENSFLIGDKKRDLESAEAAGIRGYLYENGNLLEFVKKILTAK
jgi:histidinol phosphatase-like enzyme